MRKPWRPNLNVVELAMIAALIAIVAYMAGRVRTESRLAVYTTRTGGEVRELEQRYGPSHNSEHVEEWVLRDYFHDERGGVFVDVGANHYQRFSNTYYLETALGWSGLAIDPQSKFAADYLSHRPRTRFVPMFVSDTSNKEAVLWVPTNDLIASSNRGFVASLGGTDVRPVKTNTTTLDDILERSGIDRIDFLSIDVELHEPEALSGFSVEHFRPRLVCVEAHPPVRERILDYFARHGYVVAGKYLRADSENLWFKPLVDVQELSQ